MSRSQLESGLRSLGLTLPSTAVDRLLDYAAELQRWNRAYNLTAIRDPAQVISRHLLDALSILPAVREFAVSGEGGPRLIDVGAGAGVPGIVLAIAWPELSVTVVDSVGKKARFMRHVTRVLGLEAVDVIEGRAEAIDAARPWPVVSSRAFAALDVFFRLTMPLLAPDGRWLAMKGRISDDELHRARGVARQIETRRLQVPGLDEERHLVIATRSTDTGASGT